MRSVKIGVFGVKRGGNYIEHILANNGDIVALCDKDEEYLKKAAEKIGSDVKCYTDFDEFINHEGMEAVFLANYFHEHTPYAIKCLEKDIHVLSECTSNSTMAEGVALVRAAEKSKAFYMLAENYPYMIFNQEIKKVCDGGTLGKFLYAEGEYNHPGNPYKSEGKRDLFDDLKHWRNFLPKTYYLTHSLAPIMFATGASPVKVTAFPICDPAPADGYGASHVIEKAAVMTTLNDDGSVFKFQGHSAYGGEFNSYRVCGKKGMIENLRHEDNIIMLRYNEWEKPEGMEARNRYQATIDHDPDAELIKKAGHGGGDFCVMREFLKAITTNTPHPFDAYFSTRMASVAIQAHRSLMAGGIPFEVPDFRKEEDRVKFENDNDSPFWYSDGRAPTIPCTSVPDYGPSEKQIENFCNAVKCDKE